MHNFRTGIDELVVSECLLFSCCAIITFKLTVGLSQFKSFIKDFRLIDFMNIEAFK